MKNKLILNKLLENIIDLNKKSNKYSNNEFDYKEELNNIEKFAEILKNWGDFEDKNNIFLIALFLMYLEEKYNKNKILNNINTTIEIPVEEDFFIKNLWGTKLGKFFDINNGEDIGVFIGTIPKFLFLNLKKNNNTELNAEIQKHNNIPIFYLLKKRKIIIPGSKYSYSIIHGDILKKLNKIYNMSIEEMLNILKEEK